MILIYCFGKAKRTRGRSASTTTRGEGRGTRRIDVTDELQTNNMEVQTAVKPMAG
jgi:hypothetical protein